MPDAPAVDVRMARADELDAIAELWRQSALAMDGRAREVPPAEAMRRRVDAELRSGWQLFVARRQSRLVGMLATRPAEAWLDQIFVAPGEWGTGVGKALLDTAKRAMPQGFQLRVASANERARHFYEHEGMRRLREGSHPWTGEPVTFYGWDDDSMSRPR